jgi:hypothetical protein
MPEDLAISDTVSRRWRSISDQRLDIATYQTELISASELPDADILLAESRWLATLVERGSVVPLPKAVIQSNRDSNQEKTSSLDTNWPWAWKRAATYGQRIWGIPLGAPLLVHVSRGSVATVPDSSTTPNLTSPPQAAETKSEPIAQENSWLVDRFLIVAMEFNPKPSDTSSFFQMTNGQSRLNEAWLVKAAATLRDRLGPTDETAREGTPNLAWQKVLDGRATRGIGWPKSNGDEVSLRNDGLAIEAPKRWIDSGVGLIAIITKKNRQSSTSIRFLKWLDEDEQRAAIGSVDDRFQRLPENWQPRSERPDIRRYDELLLRGLDDRLALTELQFADAKPFRKRLDQALKKIVVDPALASAELNLCHQDWNRLVEEVGSETMKRRLALAYNLDKIKDH